MVGFDRRECRQATSDGSVWDDPVGEVEEERGSDSGNLKKEDYCEDFGGEVVSRVWAVAKSRRIIG